MQSRETQITMVKWTNAGGQTKRTNERSFVSRPPAWRQWRNVKTTYRAFSPTWLAATQIGTPTWRTWLNQWLCALILLQHPRHLEHQEKNKGKKKYETKIWVIRTITADFVHFLAPVSSYSAPNRWRATNLFFISAGNWANWAVSLIV